ncbi:hypothetical protein [Microcoleus sp. herbarium14]|uniref:hypothetical protein n=1 Tax=Microcoleus sp. herbarium14 TaxID=3055439 RepID=UPI002FD20FE5
MTCTQLSLFPPAAVETTYKVGDFVKLRRKSAHAACLKKGDIIQIEAVHPRDGSCKFWNDRTKSWGYVYPDDFTLVPPPEIDSVTPIVESVVEQITELTVEAVVRQITELTVEPVVGQITKLTVEPVVEQIEKIYSKNGFLETHYKIRRNGKQHSINCPEIGCTGPYYSYRWREKKRQRAKYCPASKCPAVRKALAMGCPVAEILKIITD